MRSRFRLWMVGVISMLALVIVMGSTMGRARAEGIKDWIIDRVITEAAKRLIGHPEMSDSELKQWIDDRVANSFTAFDEQVSPERIDANVSAFCWHVYSRAIGYDEGWLYIGPGLEPYDYTTGDEHAQLTTCTRAGYVPSIGSDSDVYPE